MTLKLIPAVRAPRPARPDDAYAALRFRAVVDWVELKVVTVAPSNFMRQQLITQGIAADAVVVKPHFLPSDPGVGERREPIALFVGRLSAEKGIDTLLAAWSQRTPHCVLKIIGDGPLRARVEQAASIGSNIEFLGPQAPNEVFSWLRRARFLIVPSMCFESFGRVVIEAYAAGTPVIAARIGALTELVEENETGLLFDAGDATQLRDRINLLGTNEQLCRRLGAVARERYLRAYTVEHHVAAMSNIYQQARERRSAM